MNLHHLRYFLAVVRTGGFTQAACELHLTQPTVSSGIAELERTLGVRLFNRDSRRVDMTSEGRTLMHYALQIEDLVEEAEGKLQQQQVQPGDNFQFGAVDTAVIYLLPEILKSYMRDYPQVELSTQVAPSRYLVEDLLLNRSEFALISLPFAHPKIETIAVFVDAMPLVVGAEHRFAQRQRIKVTTVAEEPLILFHSDSITRQLIDERFAELEVTPRVAMEMRSPEAMRKLVEAGAGISFLPHLTVEESLASGSLKAVMVDSMRFSRAIGIAWRRGHYFGPAALYLLEAIFAYYGKLAEWKLKAKLSIE